MRAYSFSSLALLASLASVAACTVTTTDTSSGSGSGSGTSGGSTSGSTGLSESVPTNKMHPSFSAQDYGDGSGVHVYAAWLDDQGKWLTTSGGDVVTASDNDGPATTLFLESNEPDKVHYTTTFKSGATGVVHKIGIGLSRPAGKASAPSSFAYVGPPFSITTAVPKAMSHGDKLAIAIDPPPQPDVVGDGDSWQLTASGACIADYTASTVNTSGTSASTGLVDAQGQLTFDTSRLNRQGPSSSCDITVMVKHVHYSQLDPAYGSSAAGLELIYSDAPATKSSGNVDTTYAIEGLQARAVHTTFTFP